MRFEWAKAENTFTMALAPFGDRKFRLLPPWVCFASPTAMIVLPLRGNTRTLLACHFNVEGHLGFAAFAFVWRFGDEHGDILSGR